MLNLFFIFIAFLIKVNLAITTKNINLDELNVYKWNGLNSDNVILNVSTINYTISVEIDECNIGNYNQKPNDEYLIIKQGNTKHPDSGNIFAYIKEPKKLYFYSNSIILELKTPEKLTKDCKVTFKKSDIEPNITPITTTEKSPDDPKNSKYYSTIYLTGENIDEFNKNLSLFVEIKENLVEMAKEYTETEDFVLNEPITIKNIKIHTLEECPDKYPNYNECVKLVYALPIKVDEELSLWKGYQLNEEHLNLMWIRLSKKYFNKNLKVYNEPTLSNVLTWWIVSILTFTLLFVTGIIVLNIIWKKRQLIRREKQSQNDDFMPEFRQESINSLTPQYFQSIPPMFDKTYSTGHPEENDGFQLDEILNLDQENHEEEGVNV